MGGPGGGGGCRRGHVEIDGRRCPAWCAETVAARHVGWIDASALHVQSQPLAALAGETPTPCDASYTLAGLCAGQGRAELEALFGAQGAVSILAEAR